MTDSEKLVLLALGLVLFVVLGVSTGQAQAGARNIQGAIEGVTWDPQNPVGHEHLALPSDIGSVLWGPHPIYCDPKGPGKYRDQLIARGWEWMSQPPSEDTI